MIKAPITVFIEYRIQPHLRSVFFDNISALRDTVNRVENVLNHEILEGTDQPSLIVEVIQVKDMDTYHQLKTIRTKGSGIEAVDHAIVGGSSKINIWAFQPVDRYFP